MKILESQDQKSFALMINKNEAKLLYRALYNLSNDVTPNQKLKSKYRVILQQLDKELCCF
jgi:hypothetical protein